MDLRRFMSERRWQGTPTGARLGGVLWSGQGHPIFDCGYWLEDDAAAFEAWARDWLAQIIGQRAVDERTFHVERI